MKMSVERRWNGTDRGEQESWGKNLSQCHFLRHKSHMDLLGSNPGLSCDRKATNCLSLKSGLYYNSGSSPYRAVDTPSRLYKPVS